jgi:hypothetical protein
MQFDRLTSRIGAEVVKKQWYDNSKFSEVFQDGHEAHAKLSHAARVIYPDTNDVIFKDLIYDATSRKNFATFPKNATSRVGAYSHRV